MRRAINLEQSLDDLFESGDTTLLIWDCSANLHLCYVSKSCNDMLGYSQQDLLENKVNFKELIHPDDLLRFDSEYLEVAQLDTNYITRSDYRLKTSSGRYIWVGHTTRITRDENGRPQQLICQVTNINERIEVKQELYESKTRLELVLEGTRLGMWDWNPQTNEVQFNQRWAEMLGYDLSEIKQKLSEWESRVHPEDIDDCYKDITAHINGENAFYENIHRMIHKDGSWRYILDRGKIVERDSTGAPTRFTGTHTDITKQMEAEKRALEAVKAKTEFLSIMSHEIRSPLNIIIGISNLVLENDGSDEKERLAHIQLLKHSADTLHSLVNDILDFSKIDEGKLLLEESPVDIAKLVAEITNNIKTYQNPNKIDFKCNVDEDIAECFYGDKLRLQQIVINLLNNASKFTPEGSVTVSVSRNNIKTRKGNLLFKVKDTGIGIPKEKQAAVFEAFVQADSSTTRNYGGTGLGLAIVKRLVREMGGEIWLGSDSEDGANFQFTLELKKFDSHKTKIDKGKNYSTAIKPLDILLVDDSPENHLLFQAYFKREQHKLDNAKSASEALRMIQNKQYDVVFMDVQMPDVDGHEATRRIRKWENEGKRDALKVVALTANAFQKDIDESIDAGCDSHLTKPITKKKLLEFLYNEFHRGSDEQVAQDPPARAS